MVREEQAKRKRAREESVTKGNPKVMSLERVSLSLSNCSRSENTQDSCTCEGEAASEGTASA